MHRFKRHTMSMLFFSSVISRHRLTMVPWLLRPHMRTYAVGKRQSTESSAVSTSSSDRSDVSLDVRPLGERIKENTKTASYSMIIVAGLAVTGVMFFAIFRELLSTASPNNVYSAALEKCVNVSNMKMFFNFD